MDEEKIIYTKKLQKFIMQYPEIHQEIKKYIEKEYDESVTKKRNDYITKIQIEV